MIEANSLFITKFISFHTWFVLGLIVAAMISYSMEKISLELTSLFTLTSLMLFFHFFPLADAGGKIVLGPEEILLGFANPALITIVSLLIIGQAVIKSNALNIIPKLIIKLSSSNANVAIIVSLVTVILISAFLNNTPVVIIFIPIMMQIAKKLNISPSKVMIPLSYAAILGGMITLIGSSTNLLVSGTVENLGLPPIGFFEFIIPGGILAVIGLIYIFTILPKILPDNAKDKNEYEDNRSFASQIIISADSGFAKQQLIEGSLPGFPDITIRVIERGAEAILPPFQDCMELQENDILAITGTREEISNLVYKKPDIFLKNMHIDQEQQSQIQDLEQSETSIAELVVSPASRLIGQTLKSSGFYNDFRCPAIAIQRKGSLIKTKITRLRMVAGDVLLILGDENRLADIRNSKDVILTKWSAQQINSLARVVKTIVVFSLVIFLAAFGIVPITVTSFCAAALLIYLRCINIKQAYKAIDANVALMIVASLALGQAMQATGGAALLADGFIKITNGLSGVGIAAFFFLFIAILTNILSNSATAVLFTPIAANLALKLGMDPRILIYGVIFATNCSFITPIGYQTNLLVMSPGRYNFGDFIKGGLPLAIILCIAYAFLIKYYF